MWPAPGPQRRGVPRLGEPLDISAERFEAWLARVRRDAAREALDGLADHSDSRDGEGVKGRLGGNIRTWRDAHYSEEAL